MTAKSFENKISSPGPSFQPLYKQVEEHVTQLIWEQRWKPGDMLPNEFELAKEFGVSQGTVRKALNTLTDSKILTRRQGVGTFVSELTGNQVLYRFFGLVEDGKKPELPKAEILSLELEKPSKEVAEQLELSKKDKVIVMNRRRILNDMPCVLETIFLPEKYFPDLMQEKSIPHTLYHFFQTRFNVTVRETTDRIKADLATTKDAELLDIKKGEPLLEFTRLTKALDHRLIEFRVNRCRTDKFHYLVDLD